MDDKKKLLLIGLPASGKTTFLAALWYLVDGKHNTSLTLSELHGDSTHLNAIRKQWLDCVAVDETQPDNEHVTSMRLTDNERQRTMEVHIPDLSGQHFLAQWVERTWSSSFERAMSEADAALLFIHPDHVNEPARIDEADLIQNEIVMAANTDASASVHELVEWNPAEAAVQAQLVDILQFIQTVDDTASPFRLAVVISAWDLISNMGDRPDQWLSKRLPLLSQFLASNARAFPSMVYGVSAQGGDYNETEKLVAHHDQSDRIELVGPQGNGKDLTVPLVWLMGNND